MAIRTQQLAVRSDLPPGVTTVYTVPAGHRALIKWAGMLSTVADVSQLLLYVFTSGGQVGIVLDELAAIVNKWYSQGELYVVLEPGDVLNLYSSGTGSNSAYVNVGGVVFEL